MTERPLNVLVVDDSAVVREAIQAVFHSVGGFSVATAADPVIARARIAKLRPDVIVLDLEMPRQDGLTFLRELMATDPIPVVICSSHGTDGSYAALEALREGAVEVVAKPRLGVRDFFEESAVLLADAVRAAAGAKRTRRSRRSDPPRTSEGAPRRREPHQGQPSHRVVAIAASTGGPQSLREVLRALPRKVPGIVVVQHMPAGFTAAFARHLDSECEIEVKEAENGDVIAEGRALIAPGDRHLLLHRQEGRLLVEVAGGPLISRHRPSADALFYSVASTVGRDALGVIMTGMGDDGARGLHAMKKAGALTIAQDEASSVVFGMPKEAIACGAVDHVAPLAELATRISRWADLSGSR